MLPTLLLLQIAPTGSNPIFGTLFMYAAIAAIFYFVLWRPQAAQRKQQEQTIRSLKRGDEVVTAGGVVGEVVHIKEMTAGTVGMEDHVTIRSGESRLVVERGRITRVIAPRAAASATTPAA